MIPARFYALMTVIAASRYAGSTSSKCFSVIASVNSMAPYPPSNAARADATASSMSCGPLSASRAHVVPV